MAAGRWVVTPRDPVTVNRWSGNAWASIDHTTGASSYIIAGSLAGGNTTASSPTLDAVNDVINLDNRPRRR